MIVDELRARFARAADRTLFASETGDVTYGAWLDMVASSDLAGVAPGDVVVLAIDATPAAIATLWALFERRAIVAVVGGRAGAAEEACRLVGAAWLFAGARRERVSASPAADHPLYAELRGRQAPGMVLLSSGTSGEPKAAVHDATRFLSKFARAGKDLRTLLFLPPDHVGGLDTLFYAMSNTSAIALPRSRGVDDVCRAIAAHRVEVLPCNPSFLGLLLLQRGHERYDLSSLVTITYGAEVMPQVTLDRLAAVFPGVALRQKYGSTEFGALPASPRGPGSLWVRLGGDEVQTRVVDGMLQVKAPTTMLGYLNEQSPISPDGWVATGDRVEQDGEFVRILGRASEMINVGGEKVFPAEVEAVVLELAGIEDALVYGESNPLLGQVVAADIVYGGPERGAALTSAVRRHCATRLAPYKVPARVRQVPAIAMGGHKKSRRREGAT